MSNLIVPEIYAGIVREKFEGRLKVAQLATNLGILKNTRQGETVVFPRFRRIGDVEEMTKGVALTAENLEQTSSSAKIVQKGKTVRVFDYDDLTAFGNFIEEAAQQQAIVFARDLDKSLINEAMTTPLKEKTAEATKITVTELNNAINLFGDEQDSEDMSGICVHSILIPSLINMPEFIDKSKTYNADANGVMRKGLLGYYRNIPVFVSDVLFDKLTNEAITLIIKKNALAYMEKREINIELEREAKLKATDVVADYIYATKLVDDSGVVMLKKSL
ncbi:hypothetical protein [Anaerophilus nitritogenes]|uniref:hypothetical protein n=1 Tax=Anaerophilus nitritogenes TaxID=2498136 RepID=UPI00101CE86F|nr:hypothetical protein [Anaerophilus nitritogenes]